MAFSDTIPGRRTCYIALVIALLSPWSRPFAADIDVTVLDSDGNPVAGIAVYVRPDNGEPLPPPTETAVMDQLDKRFVPHLLVVQTGTQVEFPNSDSIAHHVYSFSKPNNFMLPLYKGELQPEISFDYAGVVTLGCNIHDDMLAYILVVDSAVHGVTDADGKTRLEADNPDGLTVSIWSPRIRGESETLTRTVTEGRSAEITFSLTEKLRAGHEHEPGSIVWTRY